MWPAAGRGTDRTKSTQMSNPFRVFLPPVADDDVDGVKLFIRSSEKKKMGKQNISIFRCLIQIVNRVFVHLFKL